MWYVYVLESINNKRQYIGYTNNLQRRIQEHNTGAGGKYTKNNKPYKLIFYEAFINKHDAANQEKFYKSGYGREILKNKLKNYFNN